MIPDLLIIFIVALIVGAIWTNDYYLTRRKVKKVIPHISDKLRAFDKVKKVIESCITLQHLVSTDRLIDNFTVLYHYDEYSRELDDLWLTKLELISPKEQ